MNSGIYIFRKSFVKEGEYVTSKQSNMEGNCQRARDKKGRFKKGFTSFSTECDINNSIDVNSNETETYVDDVNSGLELDHCENDSEELS